MSQFLRKVATSGRLCGAAPLPVWLRSYISLFHPHILLYFGLQALSFLKWHCKHWIQNLINRLLIPVIPLFGITFLWFPQLVSIVSNCMFLNRHCFASLVFPLLSGAEFTGWVCVSAAAAARPHLVLAPTRGTPAHSHGTHPWSVAHVFRLCLRATPWPTLHMYTGCIENTRVYSWFLLGSLFLPRLDGTWLHVTHRIVVV